MCKKCKLLIYLRKEISFCLRKYFLVFCFKNKVKHGTKCVWCLLINEIESDRKDSEKGKNRISVLLIEGGQKF